MHERRVTPRLLSKKLERQSHHYPVGEMLRIKIDHFVLKEGWVELVKACYISVSSRHQVWLLRRQLSIYVWVWGTCGLEIHVLELRAERLEENTKTVHGWPLSSKCTLHLCR